MAGLLAYLAALKLRVLRRRLRSAAAAPTKVPLPDPQLAQPKEGLGKPGGQGGTTIDLTATSATQPASLQQASAPAPAPAPAAQRALPASARAATVSILPSVHLSSDFVRRLELELVSTHNRFVSMLLASMAKEQLAAVAAAQAAGDHSALAAAARLHFAVVEAEGQIVAGAVFYPRPSSCKPGRDGGSTAAAPTSCSGDAGATSGAQGLGQPPAAAGSVCLTGESSEDGSPRSVVGPAADVGAAPASTACGSGDPCQPGLDPHLYVELLVSREQDRGWGSLLLAAIERHAAAHAGAGGSLAAEGGRALRAVKLLSVGGAEDFYSRRGYSAPDQHREMHKPLVLQAAAVACANQLP